VSTTATCFINEIVKTYKLIHNVRIVAFGEQSFSRLELPDVLLYLPIDYWFISIAILATGLGQN